MPAKVGHPVRRGFALRLPTALGHPLSRVTTCADEEARCSTRRATEAQPLLLSKIDEHSQAQRSGLGRNVALLDRLPVQNVPPRLEIVGAAVLIVEIIS